MAVFNTVEQMLAQLRAGEDGRAEFKELRLRDVVAPNADDLAGELVAFANAEGGAVFVGIADSGVVQGIPPERVDLVEQWLLNVATHNCDPPIRPVIRKALLPAARTTTSTSSTRQSSMPSPTATTPSPVRRSACSSSQTDWSSTARGKLPNTITLDDMPYRTFTRNQLLVNFLSRIRSKRTGRVFLESRGEGVRKILQDGEAHSGRRPEYALFGDELRLTLWAKVT